MGSKALLVGNWEYTDPSKVLTPLKGPVKDLEAMSEALTHQRFGLFTTDNVTARRNLKWSEMRPVFQRFLQDAGRDDYLLLYFSGHGERRHDEGLVLCGVDTDYKYLEGTSFDTSELRAWIEGNNRAPSTVVILDCCYAGQMKSAVTAETFANAMGTGTMVLASGANKPAKDAINSGDPSPFTAALAKILIDPEITGDQPGLLTVEHVYQRLLDWQPRLLPEPYRNVRSQGTFALAKRDPPPLEKRSELKGFVVHERIEVVDLTFGSAAVSARWETGETEQLELAALDCHRQTAVRRLGQLANAVIRIPEYADDDWYRQVVQKAWNCIGVNLFETAMPPMLRDRIRGGIDASGKNLLKVRLAFEQNDDPLESYPWEYLNIGYETGGNDEPQPLSLRPGLLIERVASVDALAGGDYGTADMDGTGVAPTVGIVNCLYDKFASAAGRVNTDLAKLPGLNVLMDLKGSSARWGDFLDAFAQAPGILLMFAPVQRSSEGVQVGFIADESNVPEWHRASELAEELRNYGLTFNPIIFETFAAKPGRDTFRGTLELAKTLGKAGIGPVVFVCHAQGFETHILAPERDPFPVLLIDALTQKIPLDEAFYYAKARVMRMGSTTVRRTFGVAGYYAPERLERKSARPPLVGAGGRSTEPAKRARP